MCNTTYHVVFVPFQRNLYFVFYTDPGKTMILNEQSLKDTEKYFDSIRTASAYYDREKWEVDYQKKVSLTEIS